MTTVVTGWTGRKYDVLGRQFLQTFKRHWPESVGLLAFTDEGEHGHSLTECAGLADFIARHKNNPTAHGGVMASSWREAETKDGYSFRTDAVKFATQLFIPEAAAKHVSDGEVLVWFDADVRTRRDVPEGWVDRLIGDADLVYLGREPRHSEIGFWAVRLSSNTRAFLQELATMYRTDAVFELHETHSAYVFDAVRKCHPRVRQRNLSPGGKGHVWLKSPLRIYTEHMKGPRKNKVLAPVGNAA